MSLLLRMSDTLYCISQMTPFLSVCQSNTCHSSPKGKQSISQTPMLSEKELCTRDTRWTPLAEKWKINFLLPALKSRDGLNLSKHESSSIVIHHCHFLLLCLSQYSLSITIFFVYHNIFWSSICHTLAVDREQEKTFSICHVVCLTEQNTALSTSRVQKLCRGISTKYW